MAENENAEALETKAEATPGTGEPQPTEDKTPVQKDDGDLADKVSMWQAMSRENEKKSHANLKRATEAESRLADSQHQLSEANARIARLQAQAAHPQLTDAVFDALAPKDADAETISKWAEQAAQYINAGNAETVAPATASDEQRKAMSQASKEGYLNTAPRPIGSVKGSVESGYEYGRRFASINNDNK
ncbi:hypothetical protein [Bifidobacterium myosotis]|uniref:Scaffolding protein n=1 Tax=Bifidobacterium myosotis TaxID=1630166 RepID=A0A5M9ZIR3_9BIFI|nr:hypothetical protein [Bifidobacterium myosotis]KAA8827243.1 hypothetical protein EMO91_09360 [Bifidobacterium myosotis]